MKDERIAPSPWTPPPPRCPPPLHVVVESFLYIYIVVFSRRRLNQATWLDEANSVRLGGSSPGEVYTVFSIIFSLYIKNEWGVRVLQEQLGLRAHSEIKQGCWLDGHSGIQPVSSWVMNLSAPPPHPSLPSPLYASLHHLGCLSTRSRFPVWLTSLFGARLPSRVRGPRRHAESSTSGRECVSRRPAAPLSSPWTLWDTGCIQVVMGYIKMKWIHMWGEGGGDSPLDVGVLTPWSWEPERGGVGLPQTTP